MRTRAAIPVLLCLLVACQKDQVPKGPPSTPDSAISEPDILEVHSEDTERVKEELPVAKVCDESVQLDMYEKRIEPLVSGATMNSCNQCHLSGSDLSMYARETPCKTMACLVFMGLVDFDYPEDSKILEQILKAEPESELITAEVIEAEYQGFYEWIVYSAGCQESLCGKISNPCVGGSAGANLSEDIASPLGSCDESALVKSFETKMYKWRTRCYGCHDNCDGEYDAPCWLLYEGKEAEPWALTEAAKNTMYNLLGLKSIDFDEPLKSPLLLKPMDEKMGGSYHGGGAKFRDIADDAYQDFKEWIENYTSCHDGQLPQLPRVVISSPKNKKKVFEGEAISFAGYAVDPQEGLLSDSVLWWSIETSNPPFAGGPGPHLLTLEKGKHLITLTATDSDGNVGTRTIKVWIKSPPIPEPETDAEDASNE